jgi:hypothetical protein
MEKEKSNNVFMQVIIIILISFILVSGLFFAIYSLTYNTDDLIHYGDDNYIFVTCTVGSGRSKNFYHGTISVEDYERWSNGEDGTIFVYSTTEENSGYRININSIVAINNYGSEPKYLPFDF